MRFKENIIAVDRHGTVHELVVHLDIDITGIAQNIGRRAFANRSKRSRQMGGLVRIEVAPRAVTLKKETA